jgi:hypothetical protein
MSGFPVFPHEVKGIHASVDTFAGIWRTHKLGEDPAASAPKPSKGGTKSPSNPFSFQVGLSLSTRGIDDEYLPSKAAGDAGENEIRHSKFAFGSGLDVLKVRGGRTS